MYVHVLWNNVCKNNWCFFFFVYVFFFFFAGPNIFLKMCVGDELYKVVM